VARDTVRKSLDLNKENVDWYYEMFPGGSLSGILDQLLQSYREVVDVSPKDYAKIAAEQLADQLRK